MDKVKYREIIEEILEDENYDMYDEFDKETIIKFVLDVIPMVFHIKDVTIGDYNVRVVNKQSGSFVSVSSDDYTGLSESCYYIFMDRFKPSKSDIESLLSMTNEAWYTCKYR